jgi:hypothetical protein
MTHLLNNMTNYFMFEVIETAYRRLEEGIGEAACLDDVIRVHDTYLNEIFLRAMQSEQHENLNTQVSLSPLHPPPSSSLPLCFRLSSLTHSLVVQIHHVIQAILRFCNLEEALISGLLLLLPLPHSGFLSHNAIPFHRSALCCGEREHGPSLLFLSIPLVTSLSL